MNGGMSSTSRGLSARRVFEGKEHTRRHLSSIAALRQRTPTSKNTARHHTDTSKQGLGMSSALGHADCTAIYGPTTKEAVQPSVVRGGWKNERAQAPDDQQHGTKVLSQVNRARPGNTSTRVPSTFGKRNGCGRADLDRPNVRSRDRVDDRHWLKPWRDQLPRPPLAQDRTWHQCRENNAAPP